MTCKLWHRRCTKQPSHRLCTYLLPVVQTPLTPPVPPPLGTYIPAATTGSQLESGDLKGASATLGSSWVGEFKRATQVLDANDTEQERAAAIFDGISSLQAAASKGDVKASKQTFVAVVSAVQDWAKSTGLASELKGL